MRCVAAGWQAGEFAENYQVATDMRAQEERVNTNYK